MAFTSGFKVFKSPGFDLQEGISTSAFVGKSLWSHMTGGKHKNSNFIHRTALIRHEPQFYINIIYEATILNHLDFKGPQNLLKGKVMPNLI